jgi:hypothetical protein
MDLQDRHKRAIAIRMACMLILFCVMCRFVPYTDDDLRWEAQSELHVLKIFLMDTEDDTWVT